MFLDSSSYKHETGKIIAGFELINQQAMKRYVGVEA
jgi:hypothetical protein